MASGLFTLKQQVQALRQGSWNGQRPKSVDYLVVAGGGAGNDNFNNGGPGGGGAGGLLTGIIPTTAGTSYTVTIGAGGTGVYNGGASTAASGNNSVFHTIVASGGGGGGSNGGAAASGGSGGGGGGTVSIGAFGAQGIANQGNTGGKSSATGTESTSGAGGGGGAGTEGIGATTSNGGNGGAGIASALSGTVTTYAGGGGGGNYGGTRGIGGLGGGGNGGNQAASQLPTSGAVNTGGGGGGGGGRASGASSGGSGIVIVSYPDTYAAASAAPNATVSTSGSGSFYNAGAGAVGFSGTTPFDFGTGNFTIEGWYNLANFNNASAGGNPGLIGYGTGNWVLVIPGGAYTFYAGGSVLVSSSAVASANVWNHFAIVRNGTTFTIYHNGTSVGTGTSSASISIGSNGLTVGANGNGGIGSVTGYMTNVRVVKGVAVYTGNFTVPTSQLQATQPAGTNIAAITGTATSLLVSTISGAFTADSSPTSSLTNTNTTAVSWNQLSPFATGLGYKNRVYTWTTSGSITF